MLGVHASLASAAVLADVEDLVAAVDEAVDVGLVQVRDDGLRNVGFAHPLVRAAIYEQLGPARRVQLHVRAAGLVDDEGAALRHRVLATAPPNPGLADELEAFARREARAGAWAGAASTLLEASRMSVDRERREQRLLRAVDAMIGAGDLIQAISFVRQAVGFAVGPLRDATMGYLAVLSGRAGEAEALLHAAWEQCDTAADPDVAALVAQRLALHGVGRLRGGEVVEWARRALELAARTTRCGWRPRPSWGWGCRGRAACRKASLRTRRFWQACPMTSGYRRSASEWPRGGCCWSRTTS